MNNKGILVVISGFSGAGKGTLMKKLISDYDYSLSVSMTTRAPREGEVHGREYYFVSKEEFESTISNDGLIEYALYCNNYYGTPREYVNAELSKGNDVILEIEAQGAVQVKKKFPEAFLIFVLTPDVEVLNDRLRSRGTESLDDIDRRLHRAAQEVDCVADYDAVIVNDDLNEAAERLHMIIQAAKAATYRNKEFIEGFKPQFEKLLEGGKE